MHREHGCSKVNMMPLVRVFMARGAMINENCTM